MHRYNEITERSGKKAAFEVIIYRIYPRIGRTFFKEKNVRNLGCGLYAGTRVLSSLICKISRHTQSKQSS